MPQPPGLGDPGGSQNPQKNGMKNRCSKRGPKNALGGAMGSLREPPGAPMKPKWEPKGSQKRSKNDVFSSSDGKMRNVTKIHYLLHFSHIGHPPKMTFFDFFLGLKMTSKPRGNHMDQKWCQNAPPGPPERVQSRKFTPRGCQKGSQGVAKMTPKSRFGRSWGTGATQRGSRGSPGTPRGSKCSQN